MRKLVRRFVSLNFSVDKESQLVKQYDRKVQELKKIQDFNKRQIQLQKANLVLNKKLKQVRNSKELQKIKSYLIQGFNKNQKSEGKPERNNIRQNQESSYIPNNLVVRKLKFLDKKVLLLGIQEQNQEHCIYIKKIAEMLNSKIILTAQPPDMPYFIKTEKSFEQEWKKFLTDAKTTKQSKFYLNPSPYHVSETCLSRNQIQLVRNSLNKSKQFNQIFYAILQLSKNHNQYIPNGLLTPLLVNSVQKIYFCDYPLLKQRQFWALAIPLSNIRDLFKVYHRQIYKNKKMIFDPRILFPKQVIQKKFAYMANIIKYATHEANSPSIFICPSQYVEQFCMQWKKDKPVSAYSNFVLNNNLQNTPMFLDYMQKLVLMDIMLEPVLEKYFIKNLSFPYKATQTLGGRENIGRVFIIWNHFKNIYRDVLSKEPI